MYEVEYKVEISKEEQDKLANLFGYEHFISKDTVHQDNYYTEATKLDTGGYNIKRYRDEGKRAIYTEKIKEEVDGMPITKEIEHEISRAELLNKIQTTPVILKLSKDRRSWSGKYNDTKLHIDMDNVKFDHSPLMRYFVEAEVMVEHAEDVPLTRELIISFLKTSLGKTDIVEAPGMFNMAFNKL